MLIELSGIDGTGKTTVAAELRARFEAAGVPCHELVIRSTGRLVLHDIAADHGMPHWRGMFSPDEVEVAHAVEMLHEIHFRLLPLDRHRQLIITDTYIARWLAMAARVGATKLARLAQIYRRLPAPDVSCRLVLEPEQAYARLEARPKGDPILGPEGLGKLRDYDRAFATIEEVVPYPVHRLPATRPVAETVDELIGIAHARDVGSAVLSRLPKAVTG